jgi:hypothetical protein
MASPDDDSARTTRDKKFVALLMGAIQHLGSTVPAEWFNQSSFVATPQLAHYSQILGGHAPPTTLYSFAVMADMHIAIDAYDSIARVPMSFFSMRQRCYSGSPDHQVLAHNIHAEFGPLLGRKIPKRPAGRLRLHSMVAKSTKESVQSTVVEQRNASFADTDTSSENGLVDKGEPMAEEITPYEHDVVDTNRDNVWGGIMVNSETTVKSDSRSNFPMQPGQGFSPQSGLGLQTAVGTAKQEETFVEGLLAVTRAKFLPQRPGY